MLTPERLKEIKERCERATEGPWWTAEGVIYDNEAAIGDCFRDDDAEFIIHAREDVPVLVAEVERLQELKDDYRLRIEHMATALGLIQSEAEALKQAIEAAKSAGGVERLDEIAKHVQAILDVLGRV